MINAKETGLLFASHKWLWRPGLMRLGHDLARDAFTQAGVKPNQIGAQAPGISDRYGNFDAKLRQVERADFDQMQSFVIACLPQGGYDPGYEWSFYWSVIRERAGIVGVLPCVSPNPREAAASSFRTWMSLSRAQYGYCFRQTMQLGPVFHCLGIILGMRPNSDLTMNTSWWGHTVGKMESVYDAGILRDIYPESYLSQTFLNARLGHTRTTLKEWIEADPARRGALEPYTDILTKWTPPVEKIPQIREELFSAGRVYYWQFFCPPGRDGKPGPFFRPDLSAPWVAPDTIPEIYRADYWKDKDPGLTY